jgi:prefoldin alpha subunit
MIDVSSTAKEDQLRKLLYELQLMQGSTQVLQQRLELLSNANSDLRLSQQSLTDMKEMKPDTPLLVPVGGGALIHAKTGDLGRVIIGVGAGVSIEMELGKALEDVSKRLEEVEKAIASVQEQLGQIIAQMQSHENIANRLSSELQGEPAGV